MRAPRTCLLVLSLAASLAAPGCGDEDRLPSIDVGGGGKTSTGGGQPGVDVEDCEGPPSIDELGLCANEVIPVFQEKPNLYFAIDSSGSMGEPFEIGDSTSKLQASKTAISEMLVALGHRIRYGMTMFPAFGSDGCGAGIEIFETREGDPVQCVNKQVAGPVLTSFTSKLTVLSTGGGTPISATIEQITPTLIELEGETALVLLTDGIPNCNAEAGCSARDCMANLVGATLNGVACDADTNCCDPEIAGEGAELNCVDREASVSAVAALADAGVRTFVIGIPGTEIFAELLDELAIAGGTARSGSERAYYDIDDVTTLTETLRDIGDTVSTSCEITLEKAPPQPELLNVYFDAELIESNPDDGWTYEPRMVTLHGTACDRLQSGDVVQVQIVAGCPTVIR